jgi:hypothetical protein
MKTTTLVFCFLGLLCATAAFGQTAPLLVANPQPVAMPDHAQHASEHAMANESSLLGSNPYTYARGEQPLSEFGSAPAYETPLGDVARAYRKQRLATPKAVKSLEK